MRYASCPISFIEDTSRDLLAVKQFFLFTEQRAGKPKPVKEIIRIATVKNIYGGPVMRERELPFVCLSACGNLSR